MTGYNICQDLRLSRQWSVRMRTQDTVTHVLVDCPNLREIRQKLGSEFGDALTAYRVCWEAQLNMRKVKQTPSRRPRGPKAWTSAPLSPTWGRKQLFQTVPHSNFNWVASSYFL